MSKKKKRNIRSKKEISDKNKLTKLTLKSEIGEKEHNFNTVVTLVIIIITVSIGLWTFILMSVSFFQPIIFFFDKPTYGGAIEIFKRNDSTFNVLILPFNPDKETCKIRDIALEKAIEERLKLINTSDSLNISVKIDSSACIHNFQEGLEIGKLWNADMVLWGDINDKCTDDYKACVKFKLINSIIGVDSGNTGFKVISDISQISEGYLLQDAEFLLYTIVGLRYYGVGNYFKAALYLNKIVKDSSDKYLVVQGYLAYSLLNTNRYDESIILYNNLIKNNYFKAKAYSELAIAYKRKGEFIKSMECFASAISIEPLNTLPYLNRANLNAQLKNYTDAIIDYKKVISLENKHVNACLFLGNVYDEMQDYDSASMYYNKAIYINPNYKAAYINNGIILSKQKKFDEAITYFSKAISLDSNNAYVYDERAFAYKQKNEFAKSNEDYSKVIFLNDTLYTAYFNRADNYRILGDYNKALIDLNYLFSKIGNEPDIFNARGRVYFSMGNIDLAKKDFIESIKLNSNKNYSAYNNLGIIYTHTGNFELAEKYYYKALKISPNYEDAYFNLGLMYEKNKKYVKAISMWEKAISLNKSMEKEARSYIDNVRKLINQ